MGVFRRRRVVGATAVAAIAIGAALLAVRYANLGVAAAQRPSACTVMVDKTAAPEVVLLGDTVRVTLTLSAECPTEPAPIDVMLVVDQSSSMRDAGKMDNAKAAAAAFIEVIDLDPSRIGLVAFSEVAGLRSPLTTDGEAVRRAVAGLIPGGRTNVSAAIDLAHRELVADPNGSRPAMIVLTDGFNTAPGAEPIADVAQRAKDDDITIATFCAGGECDPALVQAASSLDLYFDVPDVNDLPRLYRELAGTLQTNRIEQLTIRDEIPSNMLYVPDSAVPPATRLGPGFLEWDFADAPPAAGIGYDLIPQQVGQHPTNVTATARYRDLQGGVGEVPFPVPVVRVISAPGCLPTAREVFFLIDDSNCLYGQELNGEDARSAIRKGVAAALDQINLGPDRAAVIGFGDRAITFQTLTADRELILAAVDRISMRDSSARLDLAFQAVARELGTDRHDPAAAPFTITVTDGPMMATPELAEHYGQALRREGVRHYSIGVGFITQHSVLRALSEPGGYYEIPFGGDVITPYSLIGGTVAALTDGCPPEPRATATPGEPERVFRALLPWLRR